MVYATFCCQIYTLNRTILRFRKIQIKPAFARKGSLELRPINNVKPDNVKPDNVKPNNNNNNTTKDIKHIIKYPPRVGNLNNIIETTFLERNRDRVFIIGGGPSLVNFDFSILNNEDTICVNKAIEFIANPTYFITMDYTFFGKTKLSINDIANKVKSSHFIVNATNEYIHYIDGIFTDTRRNFKYENLNKFTSTIVSNITIDNNTGFGLTLNNFANGQNSGFSAVQFAILAGYTEIYLLGFDLSDNNGLTHFHSGYADTYKRFNCDIQIFRDNFISAFQKFGTSKFYTTSDKSVLSSMITYVSLSKINEIIKT